MARRKSDEISEPLPPPATTLEGREAQLANAAVTLIEKRILAETASPAETLHFARQVTVRAQLENEKLKGENEVLRARVIEMERRASSEEILEKAIRAFKGYSGEEAIDPDMLESGGYAPDVY